MTRLVNTVSNAAYAAAGLYVFSTIDAPIFSVCWFLTPAFLFGLGLVALSVKSALFHWTEAKWAQRLDEAGIYLAIVPLLWIMIAAAIGLPPPITCLAILVHSAIMVVRLRDFDSFYWAGGMVGLAIALAFFGEVPIALAALSVFVVSVVFRSIDRPLGHGILHGLFWHPGTALGFAILYRAAPTIDPAKLAAFLDAAGPYAVVGALAVLLADRIQHAVIYNLHRGGPIHPVLVWWNANIHRSGNVLHYALGAALFVLLLGQAEGWQGYAAAASLTYAPFAIASPYGQLLINAGSHAPGEEPVRRPKWWKSVLGAAVFWVGLWLVQG